MVREILPGGMLYPDMFGGILGGPPGAGGGAPGAGGLRTAGEEGEGVGACGVVGCASSGISI